MTLEERVAALEERLGMESGLRASQDRDLASLAQRMSAANHLLQALSITQGEHTTILEGHTVALAGLQADVAEIKTGLTVITTMLTTLIGQGEPGEGT